MNEFLSSPLFGIVFTIALYQVGLYICKRIKLIFLNPFLIAVILGVLFLSLMNISYEDYNVGGRMINFFLTPITIILAVPLYKQIEIIKRNGFLFLIGIMISIITTFLFIYITAYLLQLDEVIKRSFLPKSVTTPLAINISEVIEGNPNITVLIVTLTGITGASVAGMVVKLTNTKSELAKAVAIGSTSRVR